MFKGYFTKYKFQKMFKGYFIKNKFPKMFMGYFIKYNPKEPMEDCGYIAVF